VAPGAPRESGRTGRSARQSECEAGRPAAVIGTPDGGEVVNTASAAFVQLEERRVALVPSGAGLPSARRPTAVHVHPDRDFLPDGVRGVQTNEHTGGEQ
jgi:hypothetical protein